jgi:hypothetical protein
MHSPIVDFEPLGSVTEAKPTGELRRIGRHWQELHDARSLRRPWLAPSRLVAMSGATVLRARCSANPKASARWPPLCGAGPLRMSSGLSELAPDVVSDADDYDLAGGTILEGF